MGNLVLKRSMSSLLIILLIFSLCELAEAMPVFPGAKGFGTETAAGRGGQVIKVTNLNASGPGSFRSAIEASGPRVVVFEVSGTIQIDGNLWVRNPYITIAGQTAPSPGITLRGAQFVVDTHDVLIQHIRSRVGDKGGVNPDWRSAITVNGAAYNVMIDHFSASWATDQTATLWGTSIHDVTFSNCIISEGLDNSLHSKGGHSTGLLLGPYMSNIAVIGNLLAHNKFRNPNVRARSAALVNNLIYNSGYFGIDVQSVEHGVVASIVGNHVIPGPDSSSNVNYSLTVWEIAHPTETSVYLSDNECVNRDTDPWSCVDDRGNFQTQLQVFSPRVWPIGLTAISSSQVKDAVLACAGARPADRDSVDKRIVDDASNGTGRIIDSQDQVGGWPKLTENYRTLTIPANPHGDDDGDGYTNLEEWLHNFAAKVESPNTDSRPLPPRNVRIK